MIIQDFTLCTAAFFHLYLIMRLQKKKSVSHLTICLVNPLVLQTMMRFKNTSSQYATKLEWTIWYVLREKRKAAAGLATCLTLSVREIERKQMWARSPGGADGLCSHACLLRQLRRLQASHSARPSPNALKGRDSSPPSFFPFLCLFGYCNSIPPVYYISLWTAFAPST